MKSNTRFKKNTKGIECLNCKQPINTVDNFCSNCGQVNDTKPLSIKQYITELLGGFFAFDTRTINTLIPLLIKPGKITKDYIEGKRMQYVNPFQLYLHASIIFFLATGILMSIDNYRDLAKTNQEDTIIKKDSLQKKDNKTPHNFIDALVIGWNSVEETKYQRKIQENAISFISNKDFIKVISDTLFNKTEKNKKINQLLINQIKSNYDSIVKDTLFKNSKFFKFKTFKKEYLKHAVKELNKNNFKISLKEDKPFENITTSSSWLKKYVTFYNSKSKEPIKALDSLGYKKSAENIYFYKKFQNFKKAFKDGENANAYASNIISKLSIAMFFMLPIFTLFMSLLYIRNKNNYTEHLIFVFNIQTIFFILILTGTLLDWFLDADFFTSISLFGFLFYLYKAMRKFYEQRRFKTIIKFLILNFTFLMLSFLGFIIVGLLAIVV